METTHTETTAAVAPVIPQGNPPASTSPDVSGVLRDYARAALAEMKARNSIADDWGTDHPLIVGTGTVGAADVLNFLMDGFQDQRDRAGDSTGAA